MKNLFVLLLVLVLFACNISSEQNEINETVETTVKGNVSDVERNIQIENFKIVLVRVWDDWSGVQYFLNSEIIDSVRTDVNGDYSLTFDYIKGERYLFQKQYYGSPYYTESIGNTDITEGIINVRDMNAWYPTILKLNLNVTNNDYPAMRISSKVLSNSSLFFATIDVFEQNVDTIAFIKSKPNSDAELNFHYSTGNSNGDYHYYIERFTTSLQDTISLSYNIDCSTF
ncbi:MAG: hypothetical protein L3J09_12585 [Flavobacteriaceae bacterium]|nr:hypothetical protein [Flavobacteriaceae bacterium]